MTDNPNHEQLLSRIDALEKENARLVHSQNQVRQAIDHTAKFTEAILDSIPDVIGVQDRDHRIIRYNTAGYAFLGITPEQAAGKKCFELIGRRSPCTTCATKEVYQTRKPAQVEKYISEMDLWLDVRAYPVLDEAGEIAQVVEHLRDISREKQAEIQLLQAQKMEAIGGLAGGVAHDFNNMLNVISGHAELALEKTDPSDSIYRDLLQIHSGAARSAGITRQLLGFARKQTIAPKVLNLNETVEKMLKMLGRLIGEDMDLLWKPENESCTVKIDPSQIDQILVNLCVNARDAIEEGGKITIETGVVVFDPAYCRTHAGFVPGEFVMLAVSDNGSGMDPEIQKKVFEPFFSTKEPGKGTGLGLSTVYGIVKQNSGFINIYSEPGRGSAIKIYLPRLNESVESQPPPPASQVPRGNNETILVVEDEEIILEMLEIMLDSLGYTVLSAPLPSRALALVRDHEGPVDLLMTDTVMPEMNGSRLAQEMTRICPELKIVFMSGYTANVIAHQGVLEDGVHFLQKPFSMERLAEKIRQVLDE